VKERECVCTPFFTLPIYIHTNPHAYLEYVHACVLFVCACVYVFSPHTHTHTHTHTSGPYGTGDDFVAGGRGMFGDYAIHALWCVS
jgi:hypothetical protein